MFPTSRIRSLLSAVALVCIVAPGFSTDENVRIFGPVETITLRNIPDVRFVDNERLLINFGFLPSGDYALYDLERREFSIGNPAAFAEPRREALFPKSGAAILRADRFGQYTLLVEGREIAILEGAEERGSQIVPLGDEHYLAVSQEFDRTSLERKESFRVFDLETQSLVFEADGFPIPSLDGRAVTALQLLPIGQGGFIPVGTPVSRGIKRITTYAVPSGQILSDFDVETLSPGNLQQARLHTYPIGRYLVARDSETLQQTLYDLSESRSATLPAGETLRVAREGTLDTQVDPAGKYLATIDSNRTLRLRRYPSMALVRTLGERASHAFAGSGDGFWASTDDSDPVLEKWQFSGGTAFLDAEIPLDAPLRAIAFASTGNQLIGVEATVRVVTVDLASEAMTRYESIVDDFGHLALSPDGSRVIVEGRMATYLFDLASEDPTWEPLWRSASAGLEGFDAEGKLKFSQSTDQDPTRSQSSAIVLSEEHRSTDGRFKVGRVARLPLPTEGGAIPFFYGVYDSQEDLILYELPASGRRFEGAKITDDGSQLILTTSVTQRVRPFGSEATYTLEIIRLADGVVQHSFTADPQQNIVFALSGDSSEVAYFASAFGPGSSVALNRFSLETLVSLPALTIPGDWSALDYRNATGELLFSKPPFGFVVGGYGDPLPQVNRFGLLDPNAQSDIDVFEYLGHPAGALMHQTADGKYAVFSAGTRLAIIDLETQRLIDEPRVRRDIIGSNSLSQALFSPDATALYYRDAAGMTMRWAIQPATTFPMRIQQGPLQTTLQPMHATDRPFKIESSSDLQNWQLEMESDLKTPAFTEPYSILRSDDDDTVKFYRLIVPQSPPPSG